MPESPIRKLAPLAAAAKRRGTKVYHLNIGQPDLPTPKEGLDALKTINRTILEYSPSQGYQSYREKLVDYYRKYNINVCADDIIITSGGSEAVLFSFLACLNPGDEIIVCEPCYVSYQPLATLCDAKVIHLDTSVNGFYPTAEQIEAACTEKTKAVMFCSPSNPTGRIIPADELAKIAEVVKKHQIWCLSDEIYCELLYDGHKHVSVGEFPGMKDYAIIFNGFSKSFAMTGWRIGYIAAPHDLLVQCCKLHSYSSICPPIFSQYAAAEGLRHGWDEVEKMRVSYQQRRNIMHKAFVDMGLPCVEPEGAFYMFPDIRPTGMTSEEFATEAISKYNVAVVPGTCFGYGGEGFIRCCYATDINRIKVAMERLACLVKEKTGR